MGKKTLAGLLLISAILMNVGIGTVYAGTYDWMAPNTGSDAVKIMIQGDGNPQRSYASDSGSGGNIDTLMARNSGNDKCVIGPHDWERPFLGDASVDYLNANKKDAIPSLANADTGKMSPYFQSRYPQIHADLQYVNDLKTSDPGRY